MRETDLYWKNRLNADPIPWLLQSDPWTRFRTLTDLLENSISDPEVLKARQDLIDSPKIRALVCETARWFPFSITRHNVPVLSHYRLRMLSDFGLTLSDPGIHSIIDTLMLHRTGEGIAIRQTLPKKEGLAAPPDPDADEWYCMPCDSPLITVTLLKLGYPRKKLADVIDKLASLWQSPQGWFCHFFFVEGQYKKVQTGCPMAALQALEVFSVIPELKDSPQVRNAYFPIQYHKDSGKSLYYFGRSRKFYTLKYPFVWYNALYLADVLTRFKILKEEPLVRDLVRWMTELQDESGCFKPTSMYVPYKEWDFADKKKPSPWITYICCRILKRYYSD